MCAKSVRRRRTAGGGSLVHPELLPDLRLRDAGMVAHQMDEIVFRGADTVLLQRPDGQLAGLPRDFRDLALCEIHCYGKGTPSNVKHWAVRNCRSLLSCIKIKQLNNSWIFLRVLIS